MKDLLENVVKNAGGYVEARYHKRVSNSFLAQKGRVDTANHSEAAGVGIRVLEEGAWGFSATTDLSKQGLEKALAAARKSASLIAKVKKSDPIHLKKGQLARGDFVSEGYDELSNMKLSDKLSKVIEYERKLADESKQIQTARCRYNEIFEEKTIITSDGASATLKLAQPEFRLVAVAEHKGEQTSASSGAGVTGGWDCLFRHPSLNDAVGETARIAVDLLKAKYAQGGLTTVILAPSVVGLLCHEAIGHTVEADFVKSGSIAQGLIGKRVASKLVSLADSGQPQYEGYAVGTLPFDDEGIITQTTMIIKDGILVSYLHNKETAAEFGVEPTGNARAWLYDDEPLIRMRNTYLLPGTSSIEQMIAEVEEGFLCEGAGSGQADSNGEFMFGTSYVWRIKNGKKVELLREATLSGIAFDVMKTVDAVSKEFRWDLGTGHCGKGQPAKVDAGGPYIRCKMNIGGRQE